MQAYGKLPVEGIKFETIAQAVPDVIVISDQYDNILFANQKAEEVFGYSPEEFPDMKVSFLMPETYREGHKNGLQRFIQTGNKKVIGKIIEVEGLRKNGEIFPLELSLTCWKQDSQFYFMGIMRDITERKNDLKELREGREALKQLNVDLEDRVLQRTEELNYKQSQLKLITDSLPVLISYIDKDFNYTFGNKLYYSLKNTGDSIAGEPVAKVLSPEEFSVSKPKLELALKGEMVTFQNSLMFKDGSERLIQLSLIPDYSDKGIVRGVVVLGIDLTERVKYEKDLKDSNEQLEKINLDLDNFVYAASHDLKAPVSNVEGLIDTLCEDLHSSGHFEEDTKNIVRLMKASVNRLQKILNDLSGISKMKKGVSEDVEDVNVLSLVEEIEETIKPDIEITNAEVILEANVSHIPFSVSSLRSIFYNLISNGIKYRAPERKPIIKILIEKIPGYFLISFKDNGLGIKKESQNKIFGMFKRLHSHVEGTGIGLYLVKRIIDNAGGKILLQSEEGKGTEFKIYLPASQ